MATCTVTIARAGHPSPTVFSMGTRRFARWEAATATDPGVVSVHVAGAVNQRVVAICRRRGWSYG